MSIIPFRRGGTDTIPVADGGTGATTGSAALANLGGLDAPAHALIDHTGLPGVGASGGIATIPAGATDVEINAALADSNVGVVLLMPGSYTISATISMPAGKTLMGTGAGPDYNGFHDTQLNVNTGGFNVFQMFSRNTVANFGIILQGAAGVIFPGSNGPGHTAERIGFVANSQNFSRVISWRLSSNYSVRHCVFVCSGQTGTGTGTSGKSIIFMQPIGNPGPSVVEHCSIRQGSDIGIEAYGYVKLYNCVVESQQGDGFFTQSPNQLQIVSDCVANGNGGDGFNVCNSANGDSVFTIRDCMSRANTGFGYSGNGGSVAGHAIYQNIRSRLNVGGVLNFAGVWTNLGSYSL